MNTRNSKPHGRDTSLFHHTTSAAPDQSSADVSGRQDAHTHKLRWCLLVIQSEKSESAFRLKLLPTSFSTPVRLFLRWKIYIT
mmetsp:Transcript_32721/g.71784  ORF Transcript_32721/g.71784 Transcript_32721/m.71784 type:complete len:83 (-) Transcript_32721:948-1196(-)